MASSCSFGIHAQALRVFSPASLQHLNVLSQRPGVCQLHRDVTMHTPCSIPYAAGSTVQYSGLFAYMVARALF